LDRRRGRRGIEEGELGAAHYAAPLLATTPGSVSQGESLYDRRQDEISLDEVERIAI
jgi:hypothetical protein